MRTSLIPRSLPDYEGFWAGCRLGELRVQQCTNCGELRFPAQPLCPNCQSSGREWVPDAGTGTVYTFSVNTGLGAAGAVLPGERGFPYGVAVIELDSGPRMYADFDTEQLPRLVIGARVRAVFADIGGGLIGPNFAFAGEA
jgi:uncharacterized OB-fold protein